MYEYILLIAATVMWSFVGVLSKTASFMASSELIAFCRFFFGIAFLLPVILLTKQKINLNIKSKWLWIGVVGKCFNYLLENIALSMGFSYGGIIVWPTQTIFFAIISVFFLKEGISKNKIIAVILCVTGVVLISWNPEILKFMDYSTAAVIVMLFVGAGIGAGVFLLAQKQLLTEMSPANINFSSFLIASCIMAVPLPFSHPIVGDINIASILSLVGLGLISGIAFYFNAKALKKLPVLVCVLISNSCVLLAVLWSYLLFKEPITPPVIVGCVLFLTGIGFIDSKNTKKHVN